MFKSPGFTLHRNRIKHPWVMEMFYILPRLLIVYIKRYTINMWIFLYVIYELVKLMRNTYTWMLTPKFLILLVLGIIWVSGGLKVFQVTLIESNYIQRFFFSLKKGSLRLSIFKCSNQIYHKEHSVSTHKHIVYTVIAFD